jgi:hypothetical protein
LIHPTISISIKSKLFPSFPSNCLEILSSTTHQVLGGPLLAQGPEPSNFIYQGHALPIAGLVADWL